MRFKVNLVDDEPWVLEGMRVLLPWNEYGLTVDRVYTDPLVAYEEIVKDAPDAVFADIRMPEMSGIDLLRAVNAQGIHPVFIMVSGYAEFDYVQEALRLGAFDYLTKPVELDTIHKTFTQLRKKLISRRIAQGLSALDALSFGETARQMLDPDDENMDGWLAAFADGGIGEARAWAERAAPGCVWRAYAIACDRTLLIFRADAEGALAVRTGWEARGDGMIGVSSHGKLTSDIPVLLREAYMAYRQRYIDPEARFCAFERGQVERMQPLATGLRQAAGQGDAFAGLLERFPDIFRREGMRIVHAEQLWNFCAAVSDLPIRPHTAEELFTQFDSFDEQCAYLGELARASGRPELREAAKGPMNEQFLIMLSEVEANYHKPLSLRALSARHFFNLSYASELFRRATDMTFTEYVTKLRMSRAVSLMETGMELQEIAHQVGYEDYFYFSKVFKKNYGVSPTQYRARS